MDTPGVSGGDNSSLLLDADNEPQPDGFLMVLPEYGGQVKFNDEGYIVHAPDFVGEVAASSVSYDLHSKRNVYRRNGVREYLVWRIYDDEFNWFSLEKDTYVPLKPDQDGLFRSKVLPGLWLDPALLIAGEMKALSRVVERGIASPEHGAFVAALHANKQSSSKT